MATTDEIEGVRPGIDGDTGSCSRQEMRKYAVDWKLYNEQCGRTKPPSPHIPFQASWCEAQGFHGLLEGQAACIGRPTSCFANVGCYRPVAEDASSDALSRPVVVNGGRMVLPKDFDVSETSICYPFKIASWPCDLPHVTAESLILLCPARGKHRLANSYITKIHSWKRQPGAPTPLRRGSTRVLPSGPRANWSIRVIPVPE